MNDVVNGQVVAAVSQWQGIAVIIAAIVIGCMTRIVRRRVARVPRE